MSTVTELRWVILLLSFSCLTGTLTGLLVHRGAGLTAAFAVAITLAVVVMLLADFRTPRRLGSTESTYSSTGKKDSSDSIE